MRTGLRGGKVLQALKRSSGVRMRDEAKVVPTELPDPAPGAPCPIVLADDLTLVAAYICAYVGEQGSLQQPVSIDQRDIHRCAVITFRRCDIFKFGHPNEEVLHGHPLYRRGLSWSKVGEVLNSAWIAELNAINSVHSNHSDRRFASCRHFIFPFQDSTLEVVAEGFDVAMLAGAVRELAIDAFMRAASD
jgi:hypothetical protein